MYIHHRIKCWPPNLLLNRLTHPLSLSQSTHQLTVLYPPQSLTTTIVTRLYPTPLSNFALTKRINLMLLDEIVLPSRQNPRQPMQLSQDFSGHFAFCLAIKLFYSATLNFNVIIWAKKSSETGKITTLIFLPWYWIFENWVLIWNQPRIATCKFFTIMS